LSTNISGIFSLSAFAVLPQQHINVIAIERMAILEILDFDTCTCGVDMHLWQQNEGHVPGIYADEESCDDSHQQRHGEQLEV